MYVQLKSPFQDLQNVNDFKMIVSCILFLVGLQLFLK